MPEVGWESLLKRVRAGRLPGAVLLLGADAFLRERYREKIVEVLIPESVRWWGVRLRSAQQTDPGGVVAEASMQPMLAARQVVCVTDLEAWEGASGESLGLLERYLTDPAPFTLLLFEAAELDRRTRLARLLEERAAVIALDRGAVEPTALVEELGRQWEVTITPEAAAHLVERTGGQPARLAVEVAKLASYAGPGGTVDAEAIDALVYAARPTTVWQLVGSLGEGNRSQALVLIAELLRAGESPVAIVGALAWGLRQVAEAAELLKRQSGARAVLQLGLRRETAERIVALAQRWSPAQLARAWWELAATDERLKSGADRQLGQLFLELFVVNSLRAGNETRR